MNRDELPTLVIKAGLDELLRRNERTRGRETGEMYLGADLFVARLARPKIINGQCWPVDKTMSIIDLMDMAEEVRS